MKPVLPALMGILLLSCGGDRLAGGSTSETSNGLSVLVVDSSGSPAARVRVRLRPIGYLGGGSPATPDPTSGVIDTLTNESGRVQISAGLPSVRLEAFGAAGSVQAEIDSGINGIVVRLAPVAKVRGSVSLQVGEGLARVQAVGLEHAVWTDSSGVFSLDSLPSGHVRLRAWVPGSLSSVEIDRRIPAGGLTDFGKLVPIHEPGGWTDSLKVVLNTLTGGGATTTEVDSVPILVRLDGLDFPSSARSSGADLRVTDSAGKQLPFSVATWSSSSLLAHVWVRVPVVRAKDSTQWFRLRWGNPTAQDVSAPWDVFAAAAGWSGAWDLNRTYMDRNGRNRVADASSWADDGILTGAIVPDAVDGLRFPGGLGEGFNMSGVGTDLTGNFTVLVRARPEAPCALFGRGDSTWGHHMKELYLGAVPVVPTSRITHRLGWYPTFMAASGGSNVYFVSNSVVDSSAWMLLVARHTLGVGDSGTVDWFLSGSKVAGVSTPWTKFDTDATTDSLSVGFRFSENGRFRGALAEIWILRRAVSDDWIRLESECRKAAGTLVRLRR